MNKDNQPAWRTKWPNGITSMIKAYDALQEPKHGAIQHKFDPTPGGNIYNARMTENDKIHVLKLGSGGFIYS